MTTCHGCQRPLDKTAEGYVYCGARVYHMGCEPMVSVGEIKSCARCHYFVPHFDDYLKYIGEPPGSVGECHRHAPGLRSFPTVNADCFCGDWASKEKPCSPKNK